MMDILNAYVTTAYQVDNLWNVFMGVHIVLFAAIFKYRDRLLRHHRLFLLLGYLVFAFMNSRSLKIKYTFLQDIRTDLIEQASGHPGPLVYPGLKAYLEEYPLNTRIATVAVIHIIVALAVSYYSFQDTVLGKVRRSYYSGRHGCNLLYGGVIARILWIRTQINNAGRKLRDGYSAWWLNDR
jgi:hypothetical protein